MLHISYHFLSNLMQVFFRISLCDMCIAKLIQFQGKLYVQIVVTIYIGSYFLKWVITSLWKYIRILTKRLRQYSNILLSSCFELWGLCFYTVHGQQGISTRYHTGYPVWPDIGYPAGYPAE